MTAIRYRRSGQRAVSRNCSRFVSDFCGRSPDRYRPKNTSGRKRSMDQMQDTLLAGHGSTAVWKSGSVHDQVWLSAIHADRRVCDSRGKHFCFTLTSEAEKITAVCLGMLEYRFGANARICPDIPGVKGAGNSRGLIWLRGRASGPGCHHCLWSGMTNIGVR